MALVTPSLKCLFLTELDFPKCCRFNFKQCEKNSRKWSSSTLWQIKKGKVEHGGVSRRHGQLVRLNPSKNKEVLLLVCHWLKEPE